ncbi:MAG: Rieske 2Fe-2S domain-containing protein [Candidatus Baltobacteraceae bacterium]
MTSPDRRRFARGVAGAAAIVSLFGSIGFAAAYVATPSAQWQGLALGFALAGLAAVFALWGTTLVSNEQVVERREMSSAPSERHSATQELEAGAEQIGRRRWLSRLLGAALGVFGIAALFPIRSFGPNPNPELFRTKWTPGARLVREDGSPVRVDELEAGSILTVFPEGFVGDASSQTLLLRLEPGTLRTAPERAGWAPQGYVAFSKVCTHAGCPVGLYRRSSHQLLCPCHQSTFDVVAGAKPTSGPATRPLPQLPLRIAADGYVRAQSDFREPVGPSFWERG